MHRQHRPECTRCLGAVLAARVRKGMAELTLRYHESSRRGKKKAPA